MTKECLDLRDDYFRSLNAFRANGTTESRDCMVTARSNYNTKIRKCKARYDLVQTRKLQENMKSNPKEFWKMLHKTYEGET